MRSEYWIIGWVMIGLLTGCSREKTTGPIQVQLIQPSGPNCQYQIARATLSTLTSLTQMQGALGSVVFSKENLGSRPEILDSFASLVAVDSNFSNSGGVYAPLDFQTLYAASLYFAVETGHNLFSRLDSSADMIRAVPDFASKTRIVYEAKRTFGEIGDDPEVTDNAEFLSHRVSEGGVEKTLNYLFSFPTETVEDIPLGLNLGIMVHEYTHLIMNQLFWEPGIAANVGVSDTKPTVNTLRALDEGLADYFGYMATGDPAFFLCSFPGENRNVGIAKEFDSSEVSSLDGNTSFDPHSGGAVFAAINYEIGNAIGSHDEVGRSLVRLMGSLLTCADAKASDNTIALDFGVVAKCHLRLLSGTQRTTAQQIYNSRLGSYRGI